MGQNKTFMEAVAFWCSGEGSPQSPEPEESAVYLHDFFLCAKPCTGPSCQLRLQRPGISNSSICTTVGTKELKKMGAQSPFLLPQVLCCTLALWWGQASPEPVRTSSLTPVTALVSQPVLPLAVWPFCEDRTALQSCSQVCQIFSRVRKVQYFSPVCLHLGFGVATGPQG